MKTYFVAKDMNMEEMKVFFEKRTKKHIGFVQKFCKKIQDYDPVKFKGLVERGEAHDQSKYEDPEYEPYLYITWQYKCKDEGKDFTLPDGIKEKMTKATEHHVKHNRHHPECSSSKEVNLINRVDATKMTDLDIGEMVADWMAMSEEKGSNTKNWADKNVNIRWEFTDEQKDLIYDLIEAIE